MSRPVRRWLMVWSTVCLSGIRVVAVEPVTVATELSEYRTIDKAIVAKDVKERPASTVQPGYLGVSVMDEGGRVVVGEVATDSPAAKAGLKRGDIVATVDEKPLTGSTTLHELLEAKSPGAVVKLTVMRDGKPADISATLTAVSRPQKIGPQRAVLGIDVDTRKDGEGVVIKTVTPGTAAERARLKVDEVLLKIDDTAVASSDKLREVIAAKKPGDTITLTLLMVRNRSR
jgi:S1-C subfamily serine protease